jgi:hypothetical protein
MTPVELVETELVETEQYLIKASSLAALVSTSSTD